MSDERVYAHLTAIDLDGKRIVVWRGWVLTTAKGYRPIVGAWARHVPIVEWDTARWERQPRYAWPHLARAR